MSSTMKIQELFYPEGCFSIDENMSQEKLSRAYSEKDFLVGRLEGYHSSNDTLSIYLGNGYSGLIYLDDFTLYPYRKQDGSMSASVYSLIGQNICVKVKELNGKHMTVFTRRDVMNDALDLIRKSDPNLVYNCKIKAVANYGLFVDVGFGISGLIHNKGLTINRIRNPKDIGFNCGQFINATVDCINENCQCQMNHVHLENNLSNTLFRGDIIKVKTLFPLNEEESGYFVYINENTPALMDPPKGLKIPYGSDVIAVVKERRDTHPDKVRLNFLSFCE